MVSCFRKKEDPKLSFVALRLCSPSELSEEVQVSLNFTNTASWSIKGPGANFINIDGEERKPILVTTYIL